MRLRPKMTLTLFLTVIPSVLFFSVWRVGAAKHEFQSRIASQIVVRFAERPPARCQRRPERFVLERRGMKVFAYTSELKSLNPDAPPFPVELQSVLLADEPVSTGFWSAPRRGATAGRIEADGPCAIVLVVWGDGPPAAPFLRATVVQALLFALFLGITGLLVSGPIVRRIRRMQRAIDEAASGAPEFGDELTRQDEIGDLARAFAASGVRVRETIEDLKARDESLSAYVANTTHDLAIPLTVLQHRLTRARDGMPRDSEAWQHVEVALEESHYIAALIRNMSLATKLERGELGVTVHATDLREMVERVYTRHSPIAEGKRLDFNVALPDEAIVVQCDSVMVEQAMSNLVQNAVQYTPEGGHVSIILEAVDGRFDFRVLDDGPGIPDEIMDRVTTRGVRGDEARSRNAGGNGFGLSIAARVVEKHGWRLSLQSTNPGLEARISSGVDG